MLDVDSLYVMALDHGLCSTGNLFDHNPFPIADSSFVFPLTSGTVRLRHKNHVSKNLPAVSERRGRVQLRLDLDPVCGMRTRLRLSYAVLDRYNRARRDHGALGDHVCLRDPHAMSQ